MTLLNSDKMRLMIIGFVAAIVFGSVEARADFTFGEPTNLGLTLNSQYGEACAFVSTDGLELYFCSDRPPSTPYSMEWDIWVSTRATTDEDWGPPVNPGAPLNTSYHEEPECISADGLELYIDSSRPGGSGGEDLWVAKRKSKEDAWETPVNLGPHVNSSSTEFGAWISTDGLELYFNSRRAGGHGGYDLYVTKRATKEDPWGIPENLGPAVNSSSHEISPTTSDNGLWLLFSDYPNLAPRPGGFGGGDIWMSIRTTILDPWQEPVNIGPAINSSAVEVEPAISPDGSKLYFSSTRQGGLGGNWGDIYQAPIIPIVDFNGDGIVDAADMCIMVDHWGESYYLCDIGPTPLGDGVVDVEDLKILSEHLFEEVSDSTLVAHWPLDEMQGSTAHDSVSGEGAFVIGDPLWQPSDGMVDGALQLDGVDDCIFTSTGINPSDAPFSVLVWINGGSPGQVVISQPAVSDWFILDTKGNLGTELRSPARSGGPLFSQTNITDSNWHRIGFVWDGSYRYLYVDGEKVANDNEPLSGLESANPSLYIGVGKDYTAGTFFSGLIDDVRIYNRIVIP